MRIARVMGYVFGAVAGGATIAGANMVQEARRATERAGLRERALDERLRGALATIASRDSALQVVELELSAARAMALTVAETPLASRDSFVVALAGQVPLTPIAAAGFSETTAIPTALVPMPVVATLPQPATESRAFVLPPLRGSFVMQPLRVRTTYPRAPQVYALAFMAGDGLNAWLHLDRDPGGYVDHWNTIDKLAHGAMGAVITQSALNAGVPRRWAAPITCVGAVGFEMSQGYVSWKDAVAGCSGAAIATAIDKLSEGLRR